MRNHKREQAILNALIGLRNLGLLPASVEFDVACEAGACWSRDIIYAKIWPESEDYKKRLEDKIGHFFMNEIQRKEDSYNFGSTGQHSWYVYWVDKLEEFPQKRKYFQL